MTLKEYYNHIKQVVEESGGVKNLDIIFNAPNQGWLEGYKEISKLKERLLSFKYLQHISPEALPYYLGDKIATLEDIKRDRITAVKEDFPEENMTNEEIEEWSEDYRDSGYCGFSELEEILAFWENITEDHLFSSVYFGDDDISLDGGRRYLLSGELFHAMLYSFWVQNKQKTLTELEDNICNSNSIEENISNFKIEDVSDITSETLKKTYETAASMSKQKIKEDFNSDIDRMVLKYGKEPGMKEIVEEIKDKKIL